MSVTDSTWIALDAKVKVKYGHRLKEEDFRLLAQKQSVPQIAAFLKETDAYRGVLSDIDPAVIHRGQFESLLRKSAWEEYQNILRYALSENTRFLRYMVSQKEIEQILLYLSLYNCGKADTYVRSIPSFLAHSLCFDLYELASCADYDAFLRLLSPTPYGSIVRRFPPDETGQVPIPALENALFARMYDGLFSDLKRFTTVQEQSDLLGLFGQKVDLANASILFRLRLNFHLSGGEVRKHLLPHGDKLDDKTLRRLTDCSEEELIPAFRETSYGKLLTEHDPDEFGNLLLYAELDRYRRLLHADVSPVCTVIAYLELRQAEVASLIHIIECVRYNVGEEKILTLLNNVCPSFYGSRKTK